MTARLFAVMAAIVALITSVIFAQMEPEVTPEITPEATAGADVITEYPGAEWVEAGGLRFLLPGEIAHDVTVTEIEAVPLDADTMFIGAYPAYRQIEFVDYLPDDGPELTDLLRTTPVISVFNTADFEDYEMEAGMSYPGQLGILRGILNGTIRRAQNTPLPYLPLVNAAQVFHSREQVVTFNGGQGLVYLTSFAQDFYPLVEGSVQLTFQGITTDGSTYISADFPVDTSILPDDIGEDFDYDAFIANSEAYLTDMREALEALPESAFTPSLDALMAIFGSMEVVEAE